MHETIEQSPRMLNVHIPYGHAGNIYLSDQARATHKKVNTHLPPQHRVSADPWYPLVTFTEKCRITLKKEQRYLFFN